MTHSDQRPAATFNLRRFPSLLHLSVGRWTLDVERFPFLPSSLSVLPGQRERRKGAFTLIETALALLAIGLGLLAIFGLGRLGLQSNKESINDQRCDMLSNAIFETLRERNACFVDLARTNEQNRSWITIWEEAASHGEVAFPDVANLSPLTTNLVFDALSPAYDIQHISLANWNPRYQINLVRAESSPVAQNYNLLCFELTLYPDGDTYSSESRTYTTTLTNPGGLP